MRAAVPESLGKLLPLKEVHAQQREELGDIATRLDVILATYNSFVRRRCILRFCRRCILTAKLVPSQLTLWLLDVPQVMDMSARFVGIDLALSKHGF